ncbi:ferritin-like domain-containing protein [Halorubrum sp. DTA98]|uniref:ferritin-like domain-containing protein n=1 Tax=Halorubrum sp. DTA98 TaxID=3402163 RepID=UPI003AADB4B4
MIESDTMHERAERIAESIQTRIADDESSRRSFLTQSAVAGGALLALSGGTAVAQEEEEEEAEEEMTPFAEDRGTDVDVLNYALTLENLEDAFYREALEEFDTDDFVEADALADLDEDDRVEVYEYVNVVSDHESDHVDVLTQVVEILGGEPPAEMEYDFGIESVGDVLELAQVFENTGVAAYAGAAPYIESPDLVSAAVSIHSVEARHAAVFNHINGESPFPDAFDPSMSQEEVIDAVSDFIVGPADEEEEEEEDEEEEDEEEEEEEEEDEEEEEEVNGDPDDEVNGDPDDEVNGDPDDGLNGDPDDEVNGEPDDGLNGDNGNDTDTGDDILNGNDTDTNGDGILNGNDTDTNGDGILNGNDTDTNGN